MRSDCFDDSKFIHLTASVNVTVFDRVYLDSCSERSRRKSYASSELFVWSRLDG
jgi:hypothetical protein